MLCVYEFDNRRMLSVSCYCLVCVVVYWLRSLVACRCVLLVVRWLLSVVCDVLLSTDCRLLVFVRRCLLFAVIVC